MNRELLLKVADAIEANPEHFDMGLFINKCGTTACFGGWALYLDLREKDLNSFIQKNIKKYYSDEKDEFYRQIGEALELDENSHKFYQLCYLCNWKRADLKMLYRQSKNPNEKAKIAAEYVRWFVASDGGTKNL